MADTVPAGWSDEATLREVRPAVRDLLQSAEAFGELAPEEQRNLARQMVKVSSYLANPEGLDAPASAEAPLAPAQADATDAARGRAATVPGFAGDDFQAGALEAGTRAFGALV